MALQERWTVMSTVFAFDVDETLEISMGPVPISALVELRSQGHIVGICGNMEVFCRLPNWHEIASFIGQGYCTKEAFLYNLKLNIRADDYVMVGNRQGVTGASNDEGAALKAGWRFILERDFVAGQR
jgi:hypothetical protein